MRGKSALFRLVVRYGFAHFIRKVIARRKLLPGKFWVFAPLINIYRFCTYSFLCVVYQDFILLQGILAPQWEQVEGWVKSSHLLNHLGNTETLNQEPWTCKICMSWQHRNSEPWTMSLQNKYVLATQKLWTPKNPIICWGKHSKYWSNCQNQTEGWKILHFIAIPSNLLIHALRDKYNRRSNHPKARFSQLRLVANEKQPLLLTKESDLISLYHFRSIKIVEVVNRWLRRYGTVLGVSKVATYYFLLLPLCIPLLHLATS